MALQREELHKEQTKNAGFNQDVCQIPTPHVQTPPLCKQFEEWQLLDVSKDFGNLNSSIKTLATLLCWHIRRTKVFRTHLSVLSQSSKLVKGVPHALWAEQDIYLLQGAIWSILLDTIFSNDFEVFGERATHFAQQIRCPKIDSFFARWRCETAEKLLMGCGLVQFGSVMRQPPSHNLRRLLEKDHSAGDSLVDTLHHFSRGWDVYQAPYVLKNVDKLALQSIYHARNKVIQSLELLTTRFGAQKELNNLVHRVVTDAQILALVTSIHPHIYKFVVPANGEDFDQARRRQGHAAMLGVTKPDDVVGGSILFTVSPGFERYEDGNVEQLKPLQPALVYLTGGAAIPSTKQRPNQTAPSREKIQDAADRLKIVGGFNELKDIIHNFTDALQYKTSSKSVPTPILDHLLQPNMSQVPSQHTKNNIRTETFIWTVLINHLFENKFSCFSILGETLNQEWMTRYPESHPADPTSISTAANTWRHTKGTELLQNLGGTSFFTNPEAASIPNEQFQSSLKAVKDATYLHIQCLIDESCLPDQANNLNHHKAIERIVQKAIVLALRLDIPRHHYQIWSPPYDTPYSQALQSQTPEYSLTKDCAHINEGRIISVLRPGLRVFLASDMKSVKCLVPPLVYVLESNFQKPTVEDHSDSASLDKDDDSPL